MRSHHAWHMLRGVQWDSYWCVHTMHGICSQGCSGIITGAFTPCMAYAQRDAVGFLPVHSHQAWYMLRGRQGTLIGAFTPCMVYAHEFTSPLDHKPCEDKTTALFLMPIVTSGTITGHSPKLMIDGRIALIFLGVI